MIEGSSVFLGMPEKERRPAARILSCRETNQQLPVYIEGNLSLIQTQRIYAHLMRCKGCRAVAETQLQAKRKWRLPLRSATLRTGILATVGVTLVFLFKIYLPTRPVIALTPSVIPASPAAEPMPMPVKLKLSAHEFVGKAGNGYYVQLHMLNRPGIERSIKQILTDASVLQIKGPYGGRFYILAMPSQLTPIMDRLNKMGSMTVASIGNRTWWLEDPSAPSAACSLMVDLLP